MIELLYFVTLLYLSVKCSFYFCINVSFIIGLFYLCINVSLIIGLLRDGEIILVCEGVCVYDCHSDQTLGSILTKLSVEFNQIFDSIMITNSNTNPNV